MINYGDGGRDKSDIHEVNYLLEIIVNKNIIGALKMKKKFGTLSNCFLSNISLPYCSSNFELPKDVTFNPFASFVYWFCTSVHDCLFGIAPHVVIALPTEHFLLNSKGEKEQ